MKKQQKREAASKMLANGLTGIQSHKEEKLLLKLKAESINADQLYWLLEGIEFVGIEDENDSNDEDLESAPGWNKSAIRVEKETLALMQHIVKYKQSVIAFYRGMNPEYTPPNNPTLQKWVSETTRFLNSEDMVGGTGNGPYTPRF